MKMPLRLAIAIGKTLRLGVYDKEFDTITKLVDHAEATRWRKLSEEKPPKPGEYEAGWMDSKGWQQLCGWWTKGGFFQYWTSYITHWRPIVGPEEES